MAIAEYTNSQACPSCRSDDVWRDFAADQVMVDDGNPRTLGMLAEKNAREQGIR